MARTVDEFRIIRRQLKAVESVVDLVQTLRDEGKSEGGKMTQFGREIIQICRKHNIKQSFVAKLFDITPGAVSQHYNK
jgi:hypothetical protein